MHKQTNTQTGAITNVLQLSVQCK